MITAAGVGDRSASARRPSASGRDRERGAQRRPARSSRRRTARPRRSCARPRRAAPGCSSSPATRRRRLTNAARAEVEQTLEWARAQAEVIVQRARGGAEQLLAAAGHGDPAIREAVDAIVRAAESTVAARRGPERPETAGGAEKPSSSPSPPEAVPTADPKPGKSEEGPTAKAEAADEEAPESGNADRSSREERKPPEAS